MTLYIPAHFASSSTDAAMRLVRDHPFATVITPTDGEPMISHLPLLWVANEGPHGTLYGHMARANPHGSMAVARASVAVFHGPHAYISPSWYTAPAAAVPTWNYAAVHAHGQIVFVTAQAEALHILTTLAARFESHRTVPWTMALPERQRDAMVGAIVAFRMPLTRIETKLKLSQNRSSADRAGVIAALRADTHPDSAPTAQWMADYEPR